MKILYIDQNFGGKIIGGAFQSSFSLLNELMKSPEIRIRVLALSANEYSSKKISVRQLRPLLRFPFRKLNSFVNLLRLNQYLSFFQIIGEIRKFKPDILIVQRNLTFPAILAGFLTKIPVINIIRDAMGFCPKHIDIVDIATNCKSRIVRKECWKCIDRWKDLRILLKDKPKGWNQSKSSFFYTIFYKFRYFFIKIYSYILRFATLNIVASPLMKELVNKKSKAQNVIVSKITPIDHFGVKKAKDHIPYDVLNKINESKEKLLFVIPRNEGGSKGYPFVDKLVALFPKDWVLLVVGTHLDDFKNNDSVINLGKLPISNMFYLYDIVDVTLVPSIYTEAFGRVILESILHKTPVIMSPQCGASFLFHNKKYVKIVPLSEEKWINHINKLIPQKNNILDKEIQVYKKGYSPENCAIEFVNILKKIHKLYRN